VRRWTLLVVAALLIGWIGAPAIDVGAQESTPGLAEARAAAQQATQDYADAQTALGELDLELADLQAERDAATAELEALRDDVASLLVEQYINGGESPTALPADDLNEQATADALLRMVNQHETDTIDAYRAAEARRAAAEAEIQARLDEQEDLVAQLEETEERLADELATLEELERQRLEEDRRRAEEQAAEDAAAAERARQLADQQEAAEAGDQVADDAADDPPTASPPTTAAPGTPDEPVVPPPSGGGMICPVPGSSFIDSWGAPRPQGWAHQGVDMMASTGTPIVAPVSGFVTHRGNPVGGLAFHIDGSDGRYYYGAHLSAYGQSGNVQAGTVIGYVGNTGDAAATAPHLHLEIHIGGVPVNPYPYVAAVC
jgi:murein DD-endopeptidase MepM/ murein hydrolase activator NlpD